MHNEITLAIAIIIILFLFLFFSPCHEGMIAAATISGISRGYNAMPNGGSYADAMNTLSDAENMSLSSVDVSKFT